MKNWMLFFVTGFCLLFCLSSVWQKSVVSNRLPKKITGCFNIGHYNSLEEFLQRRCMSFFCLQNEPSAAPFHKGKNLLQLDSLTVVSFSNDSVIEFSCPDPSISGIWYLTNQQYAIQPLGEEELIYATMKNENYWIEIYRGPGVKHLIQD